jgi:hypothetical protein
VFSIVEVAVELTALKIDQQITTFSTKEKSENVAKYYTQTVTTRLLPMLQLKFDFLQALPMCDIQCGVKL